jgi:hypothetical protein
MVLTEKSDSLAQVMTPLQQIINGAFVCRVRMTFTVALHPHHNQQEKRRKGVILFDLGWDVA